MPYRIFQDRAGREWAAWDVTPRVIERRVTQRRARVAAPPTRGERRRAERRSGLGHRTLLPGRMANGWLCFESRNERRRLAPAPSDWARCPDERLELYCRCAEVVPIKALRLSVTDDGAAK